MDTKNTGGGKIIELYRIAKLVKNRQIRNLELNKLLGYVEYLAEKNFTENSLFSEEFNNIRQQLLVAVAYRLNLERKYDQLKIPHALELALKDLLLNKNTKN